jgi:hydroxymethylbilane synthase
VNILCEAVDTEGFKHAKVNSWQCFFVKSREVRSRFRDRGYRFLIERPTGLWPLIQALLGEPCRQPLERGPADHDRIVPAITQGRRRERNAMPAGDIVQRGANGLIGGHTAGDDERHRVRQGRERVGRAIRQHVDDRRLEARRDIGRDVGVDRAGRQLADGLRDGGFEAGETEIAARPAEQRAREGEAARVTLRRQTLDTRATWQRQAEELRDLIECLADRIIDGAAETPVAADALDRDALAMPAREQEQQIGEGEAARHKARQARRQRMALEVIDGDERLACREGQALGQPRADQKAADQPRPGRGRDSAEIRRPQTCLMERMRDHGGKMREVRAGGNFRHHAAERRMIVKLAQHMLGDDAPVRREDGHRRLIAGGFDGKQRTRRLSAPVRADVQCNSLFFEEIWHYHAQMRSPDVLSHEPRVKPHRRALPLRVGTRGSPLALAQTRAFQSQLSRFCPVLDALNVFEEHIITTTGDRILDKRLTDVGGKGLFSKEIHEALSDGRIDFAVHSLKDLETDLPPGITLACTLKREDARDVLILGEDVAKPDVADPFATLPQGAVIGSASVRRQAQLLHARPDLSVRTIRGNVQTRLGRVKSGEFDGSLLALAGLRRLGLAHEAAVIIEPDIMVPAAGQGIVGVTVRENDVELCELLSAIEDPAARPSAAMPASATANCT